MKLIAAYRTLNLKLLNHFYIYSTQVKSVVLTYEQIHIAVFIYDVDSVMTWHWMYSLEHIANASN